MKAVNFAFLFVCTLGAFVATCTLMMAAVAYPPAAIAIYIIIGLAMIAGLIWWLFDGDITSGLQGAGIALGVLLGIIAKWRGMVG